MESFLGDATPKAQRLTSSPCFFLDQHMFGLNRMFIFILILISNHLTFKKAYKAHIADSFASCLAFYILSVKKYEFEFHCHFYQRQLGIWRLVYLRNEFHNHTENCLMIDFLLKAIKKRLTRSYSSLGHERLLRDSTDKQKKLD